MTNCKTIFHMIKERDKERSARTVSGANPDGWTIHTAYHWSRPLKGKRLDYWPKKGAFRYDGGNVRGGNIEAFISKVNLRGA